MKIFFALLFFMFLILPFELQAQLIESDTIQDPNKKMVSVPVTVSDREGRYISGLKKEDFSVYQDGVKQKITFFDAYEEPVNIALLIDTSGSTRDVIKNIKGAAKDFIELLNRKDQCLLATFDSEVKILSPFTSNHQVLKLSVNKIKPPERGATFMYSAVNQIARKSFANVQGRKVIILLSDGKDFGGSVTKDELLNLLEESDVLIYTIFYKTDPTQNLAQQIKKYRKKKKESPATIPAQVVYVPTAQEVELLEKNVELEAIESLKKMSDTTAGRFYAGDLPDLKKIFRKITGELTQQYRLGYRLKDAATNGAAAHDINVKVERPDVVVRTRGKIRTKQS